MKTKLEDNGKHAEERRTFALRLAFVILLTNLLVYGMAYWMLASSQSQYEMRAAATSQNVAKLLEQNTSNIIEKIDVALYVVADELGRHVASGKIKANRLEMYLRNTLHTIPELGRFCITGTGIEGAYHCDAVNGAFVQTTIGGEPLDLRDASVRGLIITAPTFSEKLQKWTLQILRRYNKPNGAYGGVAGVVMDLNNFSTYFALVSVGEKGHIALLDSTQGVVARYPELSNEERKSSARGEFVQAFQQTLQKNPYTGTYLAHSQAGGVTQLVSYQKVWNWPLFVQVGLPEDEYLAGWYYEVRMGVLIAAIFSLFTLVIGYLIYRHSVARRAVLDMLTQKESLYRSFAEISNDWFWEQDENLVFTKMSGELLDTYRSDPEQFVGKTRWKIAVDVPEEKMVLHKEQVMAHQPFKDFEYSFYNLDGEKRTISASGMPVFDDDGNFIGYRGTGKDVTERRLYEESIQRMAQYDSLTGLPNRVLFNNRIEMAISLSKREGHKFALLYFDLDKFKPVNDNYGHDAGDNLLQQVAQRVSLELRDADTVARLGGDEFAILQMGVTHREDTEEVASRIIAALSAPFAVAGVGEEVRIGASIGIALFPEDANSRQRLLKVADTAMYEAKKTRNCYRMYTSSEHLGAQKNGEKT